MGGFTDRFRPSPRKSPARSGMGICSLDSPRRLHMAAANKLRPMLAAIRCAIYTRKSTDEGLESDFNTLDAQRESAEAFIVSQRHEGWSALPQKYDDGGFT